MYGWMADSWLDDGWMRPAVSRSDEGFPTGLPQGLYLFSFISLFLLHSSVFRFPGPHRSSKAQAGGL